MISVNNSFPELEFGNDRDDLIVSKMVLIHGICADGNSRYGFGVYQSHGEGWRCYRSEFDYMLIQTVKYWMYLPENPRRVFEIE